MYCTSYSDALAKSVFSKSYCFKAEQERSRTPTLKIVFEQSGADGLEKNNEIKNRIVKS